MPLTAEQSSRCPSAHLAPIALCQAVATPRLSGECRTLESRLITILPGPPVIALTLNKSLMDGMPPALLIGRPARTQRRPTTTLASVLLRSQDRTLLELLMMCSIPARVLIETCGSPSLATKIAPPTPSLRLPDSSRLIPLPTTLELRTLISKSASTSTEAPTSQLLPSLALSSLSLLASPPSLSETDDAVEY